uniref:uncharacterized protein LOC124054163 isoform X2 n=1 Tax=Scatophagus argus TaxID=75038 RepID=UPI001ED81492|nr:uncharacterized protein LOC124054163 isoform X2 [Scatophagus argus]XP_046235800.1 uncharacterized protein LOC124054173 isoform X2 [Scatophagus argus]
MGWKPLGGGTFEITPPPLARLGPKTAVGPWNYSSASQQREPELLAAEPCGAQTIAEVDKKSMTMKGKRKAKLKPNPYLPSEISTSRPTRVSAAAPGSPSRPEPHTHPRTFRKLQEWSLEVRKKTLIVGDSNLSRIPPFTDANIQIDSYPGANFHHITAILKKIPTCHTTTQVILSVGLNNCLAEHDISTITKQLQQMWSTSHITFPNATIYIPIINFSHQLDHRKKSLLTKLNNVISSKYTFIPEINPLLFQTQTDNIHWTGPVAEMLFRYWKQQLNL